MREKNLVVNNVWSDLLKDGFQGDPDAMVVITRTNGQAREALVIPRLDAMKLGSREQIEVLQKVRELENKSPKDQNTDYVFITKASCEAMLNRQSSNDLEDFVKGIDYSKIKVTVLK